MFEATRLRGVKLERVRRSPRACCGGFDNPSAGLIGRDVVSGLKMMTRLNDRDGRC